MASGTFTWAEERLFPCGFSFLKVQMVSKTFGYALRAAAYVAANGKEAQKVSLQSISGALDIPHHFLGKIMQDLVRHGVLDSTKGPNGGFFPNQRTATLPLSDILRITDGSLALTACILGIPRCDALNPCPLHEEFSACRSSIVEALRAKTLGEVAKKVADGEYQLSRLVG
jgi:Rrf2 family protein